MILYYIIIIFKCIAYTVYNIFSFDAYQYVCIFWCLCGYCNIVPKYIVIHGISVYLEYGN